MVIEGACDILVPVIGQKQMIRRTVTKYGGKEYDGVKSKQKPIPKQQMSSDKLMQLNAQNKLLVNRSNVKKSQKDLQNSSDHIENDYRNTQESMPIRAS